jgi:NAD-reducing hydrogenase small subunit
MARLKLATIWLGGCSGCHMSFLDLDEWLFELAALADVVYSPLIDIKEYPADVDVVLVEGAVANEDNEHLIRLARERTRVVVAFGDCAVTGNVTALRNPLGGADVVLERSYLDPSNDSPRIPLTPMPPLLDQVKPVHQVVPVDLFLPGCPPSAKDIRQVLQAVTAGNVPNLHGEIIRFG